MKLRHKTPCNECPFRRKSLPGYLGNATPEEFLGATLNDTPMPCHKTVDYTKKTWRKSLGTERVAHCAGSLIFYANMCKLHRDRSMPRLEKDRENVFSRPDEFLKHHTGPLTPKEPE